MSGSIAIINPERDDQHGVLYPGQPLFVRVSAYELRHMGLLAYEEPFKNVEMVNPRDWRKGRR